MAIKNIISSVERKNSERAFNYALGFADTGFLVKEGYRCFNIPEQTGDLVK